MNIVTLLRTLNEERNIERFVHFYRFSDAILISDSGSTDRTIEIAQQTGLRYGVKVQILPDFPIKYKLTDEVSYTNEPVQINLLIRTGFELFNPDWFIYDDCDSFPNENLYMGGRLFFRLATMANLNVIHVNRLYVYKKKRYFPQLNDPGPSLWAWAPKLIHGLCDESDPTEPNLKLTGEKRAFDIQKPFVLLHDFAPDDETINKKLALYRMKGKKPLHPKVGCGRLEPLPEWAKEYDREGGEVS
jgi:glycosyltransferase involved in cell wall biosynthesis